MHGVLYKCCCAGFLAWPLLIFVLSLVTRFFSRVAVFLFLLLFLSPPLRGCSEPPDFSVSLIPGMPMRHMSDGRRVS
ncbi:hypothetical protein BDP67DRAFT_521652 [Colletotrichum lupini]|nr:hypothetical protein BDP67DRAFT_521652 [Colletotrichum lupini]